MVISTAAIHVTAIGPDPSTTLCFGREEGRGTSDVGGGVWRSNLDHCVQCFVDGHFDGGEDRDFGGGVLGGGDFAKIHDE